MLKNTFMRIVTLMVMALMVGACTRSVEHKAGIKLILPSNLNKKSNQSNKVGAQAVLNLKHLIVNIRGEGIASPIFFSWDSHGGKLTPPSNFVLDVPGGNSRLIQVLGVYEEVGVSAEQFYYGDVVTNIASDMSIEIFVSLINNVLKPGEGNIVGRYIDSLGVGPTGKIAIRYTPLNKPTMTVHYSEIFGGYFRVFALQGVAFEYFLPDGSMLFPQPISADPADTASNSILLNGQSLRAHLPTYFQDRGGGTFEPRDLTDVILGWWGPGATGKTVCYPPHSPTKQINGAFTDAGGTAALMWGSHVTVNTGGISSGSYDSENLCTNTGTRFIDFMSLDAENIANNDALGAFRGPFIQKLPLSGNYRTGFGVNYLSGTLSLDWEYLPGVHSTSTYKGVDGADVFLRILAIGEAFNEEDIRVDDGIACGAMAGFSMLYSKPAGAGGVQTVNISTGLPANFGQAYNEGRVLMALCPYASGASGKFYFKSGEIYRNYMMGGGGGIGGPATKVGLKGNLVANTGSCADVDLAILDSSNNYASYSSNPSGLAVTFPSLPANVNIYLNGCGGTNINAGTTIPANENATRISISGSIDGTYAINTAITGLTSGSDIFSAAPYGTVTNVNFTDSSGNMLYAAGTNVCTPMKMMFFDSYVTPQPIYAATVFPLSGSSVSFYSNASCTTPITSMNVAASSTESPLFYFKASTAQWTTVNTLVPTYNANGVFSYALSGVSGFNVAGAGQPATFVLSPTGGVPTSGLCQAVQVQLVDYAGAPVNAPSTYSAVNLNIAGGSEVFWDDPSCTVGSSPNKSVTISTGTSLSSPVYWNPTYPMTFNYNVIYSSGSGPSLGGGGTITSL